MSLRQEKQKKMMAKMSGGAADQKGGKGSSKGVPPAKLP